MTASLIFSTSPPPVRYILMYCMSRTKDENSISDCVNHAPAHTKADQWAVDDLLVTTAVQMCRNRCFCNVNFGTTEIQTLEATTMKHRQAGRCFLSFNLVIINVTIKQEWQQFNLNLTHLFSALISITASNMFTGD